MEKTETRKLAEEYLRLGGTRQVMIDDNKTFVRQWEHEPAEAERFWQTHIENLDAERRKAGEDIPASWMDKLAEQGRLGQKTQAGVYKYEEGSRKPIPDPEVEQLIEQFRKEQGITPRELSDQEILERCVYVMINEGAKILEEGIADRPLDIDIVWIYGYGFPAYRGGPMFWADQEGLDTILSAVKKYQDTVGGEQWEPAALLEKLVAEGRKFADL